MDTDTILLTMLTHIKDNNLDIDPKLIRSIHKIVLKNSTNSKSILDNDQSLRDMKNEIEKEIDNYIKNTKEKK